MRLRGRPRDRKGYENGNSAKVDAESIFAVHLVSERGKKEVPMAQSTAVYADDTLSNTALSVTLGRFEMLESNAQNTPRREQC